MNYPYNTNIKGFTFIGEGSYKYMSSSFILFKRNSDNSYWRLVPKEYAYNKEQAISELYHVPWFRMENFIR